MRKLRCEIGIKLLSKVRVFMGWVNPENSVKPTQITQKNGLGNWVGMVFKNEKLKNKWVSGKIRPKPKKPLTQ